MGIERWTQRNVVKAVHDNDLEQFLSSIGVLDEINSGLHNCSFCKKQITLDNLGAVYPFDKTIAFACDLPTCLIKIQPLHEDLHGKLVT